LQKEIKDEEIAMLKQEIENENQGNSNEEEQLKCVKEDLRKELMRNTQLISNLSVKDKQPVQQ
jgi:hypothetical protein